MSISDADYSKHDALGLAELVKSKQVKPSELVDAALARIDRLNPQFNAVIHRFDDKARAEAHDKDQSTATGGGDAAKAPFYGVPFVAKDLLSSWAGLPLESGTRFAKGFVAKHDSEIVRRYRQAGVILVGKTNTPELGLVPTTEPEAFGAARNPWDPSRTTGGSSGGAAGAVAAGMVPMAGGGDGGGSIRIPASCCGLFGYKPSRGRTPLGPDQGEAWQGFVVEHVLTRSVRDSAAMLDALSGPEPGGLYSAPPPERAFASEVGAPTGKLRIAFTTRALLPADVHPDCVKAVLDAAKLLESLGHEVIEAHPTAFDAEQLSLDFLTMLIGETAASIRELSTLLGRRPKWGELEAPTAILGLLGDAVSSQDYAVAVRRLKRLGIALAPFFATHDVLLTPTLAQPPVPLGTLMPKGAEKTFLSVMGGLGASRLLKALGAIQQLAKKAWNFAPFAAPFNITGQPAFNAPLYWNDAGLPIGVQLVGRMAEDGAMFRLAAQLEGARPWQARRAPNID